MTSTNNPKPRKSIVIQFRLKPFHLAKALDGLVKYDKSFEPESMAQIAKATIMHGINYLTAALPNEPTRESQLKIDLMTTQGRSRTRRPFDPEEILRSGNQAPRAGGQRPRGQESGSTNPLEAEIKTDSQTKVVEDFGFLADLTSGGSDDKGDSNDEDSN